MSQPPKKAPAHPRETKPAAETVTIEVAQPTGLRPNIVRVGRLAYGPSRRVEVSREKLEQIEGEYTVVSE